MNAPALICPDCGEDLLPSRRRCACGWHRPELEPGKRPAAANPLPRNPAWLHAPEPPPPTPAERERARAALAAIRALTHRLTARRPAKPGPAMTEAERIIACTHPRYGVPEPAARFGARGYARCCLECGHVDLVHVTPAQLAEILNDVARLPPRPPDPVLTPEPGADG